MTADISKITITIMGKEYQLSCPTDEQAHLQQAARNLDQQMRGIRDNGKVVGLDRIAIMAAVNLSHQLLKEQSKHLPDSQKEQQLKTLHNKLDMALNKIMPNNEKA